MVNFFSLVCFYYVNVLEAGALSAVCRLQSRGAFMLEIWAFIMRPCVCVCPQTWLLSEQQSRVLILFACYANTPSFDELLEIFDKYPADIQHCSCLLLHTEHKSSLLPRLHHFIKSLKMGDSGAIRSSYPWSLDGLQFSLCLTDKVPTVMGKKS